jgi:hypothetical protein
LAAAASSATPGECPCSHGDFEVREVGERAWDPLEVAARERRVRLGLGRERRDEHVVLVEPREDRVGVARERRGEVRVEVPAGPA